jgi:CBS domain-containing protein
MKVEDIMTRDVRSCTPETNLSAATSIMWETDCGILPIVADTGNVVGVITDRDIAIALGSRNQPAAELTVGAILSGQVLTCRPSDDLHEALEKMRERRAPASGDRRRGTTPRHSEH